MLRTIPIIALMTLMLLWGTADAGAASARIIKVLPQFVDMEGRFTLSPSLYERDAYQNLLRNNPKLRSGMRFMISWRSPERHGYRLRMELRGSKDNAPTKLTLETNAGNPRGRRAWTEILLKGDKYESLGELLAWRATLWKGEQLLSEDKSFLW